MKIIKLNATDSTNAYLKKLVNEESLENYSVVAALKQTSGRGQMGTVWESELGKNLTFSVLIRCENFKIVDQFYLSMAVSLGVLKAINDYVNNMLYVKWPNDILAEKDKISGILIENILQGSFIKYSVVGIGLNVNQKQFSSDVKNVTSLKKLTGAVFNKDEVLKKVVDSIKKYVQLIDQKDFDSLKKLYINELFKYNKPAMFEDNFGAKFLGKIVDVSEDGRLVVELDDEKTRKFNLKEIKFASR